jgi:hypothetical protein
MCVCYARPTTHSTLTQTLSLSLSDRFHRRLVRALIGIWANETVQTDINTRIDAVLRIRQLCIELPAASNVVPLVSSHHTHITRLYT